MTVDVPPWLDPRAALPDPDEFLPSEQFMAGAISTMPPFNKFHPAWCLPIAKRALEALGEWEPDP
jgi:hypothetical protein